MSARSRCHCSYDHRLKELDRTSGDPALAIDLGIPASIVMGWLCNPPQQVVTLDVLSMEEQELEREVLMLRRRVGKLLALLRFLYESVPNPSSWPTLGYGPDKVITRIAW